MVTSYYDWSNIHEAYQKVAATIFPVISETNLRATLGILARVVAPGRGRPGAASTAKGGIDMNAANPDHGRSDDPSVGPASTATIGC
jgi:hypothetical protein